MKQTFLKIKIVRGETLELVYRKDLDQSKDKRSRKTARGVEEYDDPVHDDLHAAMGRMQVHWALLCGQIPYSAVTDPGKVEEEALKNFRVTSIHIKPAQDGKDETFKITGVRTLEDGKTCTINTPSYSLNIDRDDHYKYLEEMAMVLKDVETEVKEYLAGKIGQDKQTKMEFPESDDETEGEDGEGGKVTKMHVAKPNKDKFDQEDIDKKHRESLDKKDRKKRVP